MKKFSIFYFLFSIFLVFFSYGYVDPNLVLSTNPWYQKLQSFVHYFAYQKRSLATLIFLLFWFSSFALYGCLLSKSKKKQVSQVFFKKLVLVVVLGAFFCYPFLSNDIFNYIFTAKILTLYHENPYIVMPEEFVGDPWLSFLHWSNRTALYGPSWLVLSVIPLFLAGQNLILSVFCFKALTALFYIGTVVLLSKIAGLIKLPTKIQRLIFFAFNPLVIFETLVSSHNDIVLVFFALLAFYFLVKDRRILAILSFVFSVLIKFATVFLLPVFLYAFWLKIKNQKVDWSQVFVRASFSMFLIYFLSPLREELYPWYLVWVIPFVALSLKNRLLVWLTTAFSAGTLLRYAPFLYTGNWGGITPKIKFWVTVLPVGLVLIKFGLEKLHVSCSHLQRNHTLA